MRKKTAQKENKQLVFNDFNEIAHLVVKALLDYSSRTEQPSTPERATPRRTTKDIINHVDNMHHKRKIIERSTSAKKIANLKKDQMKRQNFQAHSTLGDRSASYSNLQNKPIQDRTQDILKLREWRLFQEKARQMDKQMEEIDYTSFKKASAQEWLQTLYNREQQLQQRLKEQRKSKMISEIYLPPQRKYQHAYEHNTQLNINSQKDSDSPARNAKLQSKSTNRKTQRTSKTPKKRKNSPITKKTMDTTHLSSSPHRPDIGKLSDGQLMSLLRANRDRIYQIVQTLQRQI